MTPKEKAEKVVAEFVKLAPNTSLAFHKQCALIAIQIATDSCLEMYNDIYKYGPYFNETRYSKQIEGLKQEIEKL